LSDKVKFKREHIIDIWWDDEDAELVEDDGAAPGHPGSCSLADGCNRLREPPACPLTSEPG
jgi:hypothetical protein